MSIALMTAAFKSRLNSTHKFVLLALCDNANDQGECYPSVSMLSEKTSLSERTVQGSIAALVRGKYITRDIRSGRSTYYFITDPRTWCTPAGIAPPQDVHPTPAAGAPPPPQDVHPTPAAGAPITINEPSIEPSIEPSVKQKKREQPAPFDLPIWIPVDAWDGYIEMRKKNRKEPTDRAVQLLLNKLEKLKSSGQDIAAVLDKSTVNGWTDVYAIKSEHQARASPTSYESAKDRSRREASEQLTGRKQNEQRTDIIDIN